MSGASASLSGVTSLATHTAISLWAATSTVLALIVLVALFFAISRFIGNAAFICLLIALYGGYAIYALFPYISYLPTTPASAEVATHALLYAAFVALFYLILRRIVVTDFLHLTSISIAILSFLGAAFLLAFGFHLFAVTKVYTFSSVLISLFAPAKYFFWWFVAPAAALFFFVR